MTFTESDHPRALDGAFTEKSQSAPEVTLPTIPPSLFADAGDIRVTLETIGEGYEGEYDPEDPDDAELFRFTVSQLDLETGEYEDIEGASWCTQIAYDPQGDSRALQDWVSRDAQLVNAGGTPDEKLSRARTVARIAASTFFKDGVLFAWAA